MRNLLLLVVPLAACVTEPPPVGEPTATFAISELVGEALPAPVGVTVEPETGRVFLLDAERGIYELHGESASLLVSLEELPTPDVPLDGPFSDFAAIGDQRFAMIAPADGFLLDLGADTLQRHFCYEPGWMPEDTRQMAQNLAFDAEAGLLYAQPQSLDSSDAVVSAEVGTFDAQFGGDLDWFPLESPETNAGGVSVPRTGELLLAQGERLMHWARGDFSLLELGSLAAHGVGNVDGLAWDGEGLWVLDGGADLLVRVQLELP